MKTIRPYFGIIVSGILLFFYKPSEFAIQFVKDSNPFPSKSVSDIE